MYKMNVERTWIRAMKFERLTDPGPKGGKAAFSEAETPEQLERHSCFLHESELNCRLERTTAEMTAPSGSPCVSRHFYL
jgi:hypothetical protein